MCGAKPREINALLEMVPQAVPLILNEISGLGESWTFTMATYSLGFLAECPRSTAA